MFWILTRIAPSFRNQKDDLNGSSQKSISLAVKMCKKYLKHENYTTFFLNFQR